MPTSTLVGLPETTVKESKDRVRSAIVNSNFQFPAKRITMLCKIYRNIFMQLLIWKSCI
ncbi:hypothetical protein L2D57_23875 [Vibrio harveyi]